MSKLKFKGLFPSFSNRFIYIGAIVLSIFGSFMIISAEMGESSGDLAVISKTSIKQFALVIVGLLAMFICTKFGYIITKLNRKIIWLGYLVVLFLLLLTRAFSPVGGAYAWIRIGSLFSIQPSEIAKLYLIVLASNIFMKPDEKNNIIKLRNYIIATFIYAFVIIFIQKDFGSALVLIALAYICILIPPYDELKKIQNVMLIMVLVFLLLGVFLLSDTGTKLLSNFDDNYQIMRFLSSANPFNYQYDSGYHLIMSMVSIANGGLYGLGYGKSIHKFMNFPNPSTDFILAVTIEELGLIFGLIPILLCYMFILIPLIKSAINCKFIKGKIIMIGTFMYFILHFVLNVGGISGLIPLTGVPLLLVSSGGSSLVVSLSLIGLSQSEIIHSNEYNYRKQHENSIRKI